MRSTLPFILLAALANAQFGPSSSSSSSSASAPTARTSSLSPISTTPTPTTSSANLYPSPPQSTGCVFHGDHWDCASSNSAASPVASPTESTGCVLHGDHYHCDSPSSTTVANAAASPTESTGCVFHINHWDCEAPVAGLESTSEESGDCIIHVGHTHGNCGAEAQACGVVQLGTYNNGLHIGAIFIVLVTSGLGVALPLLFGSKKDADPGEIGGDGLRKGVWGTVFFVGKHFGTGVILSTAFIHLLYHGFVMFANECIGTLGFEATAPAIALAAAFLTFLLDFFGSRYRSHRPTSTLEKRSSTPSSPSLKAGAHGHDHFHHPPGGITEKDLHWQVLILEAGIVFHSIMIGVTLGAGGGEGWVTLLIVVVFHQFFEGMALGSRIAGLVYKSRLQPILMAGLFTLITPIGIAIGVGVHASFSANGKAPLLSVGILNSISAGILLYSAFQLLASDFVNGPLKTDKIGRVVLALGAVMAGMIAMSVLGKWA